MPLDPPPVFEGTVSLGEANLFVRRYGNVGPELLVIHGGPDWDHEYLLPYLVPLVSDMRLVFFDLRGCGRSSRFEDSDAYHPDAVVRDIRALIPALDLDRPTVLGFSFGGRIALRLLDRHPEIVGPLILASSTAYRDVQNDLDGWPEYVERRETLADTAAAFGELPATADATRRLAYEGVALDAYNVEAIREVTEALDRVRFSGEWMRAWRSGGLRDVKHADYEARLRELRAPALILHGEKDMRFPVSVAHRLHKAVPQSELVVLPRTGHMAHVEAPLAWRAAVRAFVRQTARQRR